MKRGISQFIRIIVNRVTTKNPSTTVERQTNITTLTQYHYHQLNNLTVITCTCIVKPTYTVEPPNKGHIGTSHFVLCRLSLEIKNVLVLWESEHFGPHPL